MPIQGAMHRGLLFWPCTEVQQQLMLQRRVKAAAAMHCAGALQDTLVPGRWLSKSHESHSIQNCVLQVCSTHTCGFVSRSFAM